MKAQIKIALLLLAPALSLAQVPVDDDGNVIGSYQSQADVMSITDDGVPLMSYAQLQELVGPIALYPDDLLAIVLPASAYPLQIVEAARFLEALETDSSLEPDPDWDDSIVALTNYPEVVELLNDDLDWTLRLGEAVVAQQTDVIAAVETFRDRAYAAGNLESDAYQTVSREDDVIHISPVSEDVIYVPYYEPAQVVYYQPRPVYYYHPRPYPVYYYPYSAGHYFDRGYFWGVTTAFSIGWRSDSLHTYHHSYRGHPYYGRTYWNDGWYRRPSIHVYNTTYVNHRNGNANRHSRGDQWHASNTRREYVRREGYSRATARADRNEVSNERRRETRQREDISFRERDPQVASRARETQVRNTQARNSNRQTPRQDRVENTRGNTRETTRDARREQPTVTTRNTNERRDQRADRAGEITFRERNGRSGERTPTRTTQAPSRTDSAPNTATRTNARRAPTRTEQPAARTQRTQTRTEQPAARTQRTQTRTERPAARSTPSPSRTQQAPSQQQPRRSEPRRQEQPSRSRESSASTPSRSQPAERSSQRSEQRSSRSRDRKER